MRTSSVWLWLKQDSNENRKRSAAEEGICRACVGKCRFVLSERASRTQREVAFKGKRWTTFAAALVLSPSALCSFCFPFTRCSIQWMKSWKPLPAGFCSRESRPS